MNNLDVIVYILLLIGAINWGLVGIFNFDLVAFILGDMTALSRIIYTIVGLAAAYEIVMLKPILKRWDVHFRTPSHA